MVSPSGTLSSPSPSFSVTGMLTRCSRIEPGWRMRSYTLTAYGEFFVVTSNYFTRHSGDVRRKAIPLAARTQEAAPL
jgi:hypothetical protein